MQLTLVEAHAWGRSTVASALAGSDSDNVCVDGAGDAVDDTDVELGQDVFCNMEGISRGS